MAYGKRDAGRDLGQVDGTAVGGRSVVAVERLVHGPVHTRVVLRLQRGQATLQVTPARDLAS